MKNTISIRVEFYFKGKKYSPSMVLNLDQRLNFKSDLDTLYSLLATKNNIDFYSYEYEMLVAEDLLFYDAKGTAVNFLEDRRFDFSAFELAMHNESVDVIVSNIAKDYMSIDDLSSEPNIKAALLEAYKQGKIHGG